MAAIASTDVTVTVLERNILGKLRMNECKIQFGDGALTYPAGGIPMPAIGAFGMNKEVKGLTWYDESNGDGFVYKYDKTNRAIRIYSQGVALDAAGTETLDDHAVTAGVGVGTISLGAAVAGAGTYGLGALKELTTADAPAATALYAGVWGK